MSFETYAALQTEIAEWLDREDLTAKIPTFIRLFEAQAERKLRVREMLTSNLPGYVTAGGSIILPDDFLALHNLTVVNGSGRLVPLTYVSKHQLDARIGETPESGFPEVYSIDKAGIQLAPIPNATYQYYLSYWSKIPKLGDVSSNWLLLQHPDLYLYGSLIQAEPYLKHDERIGVWGEALTTILEDITLADERAMRGGTPLKTRMKAYG